MSVPVLFFIYPKSGINKLLNSFLFILISYLLSFLPFLLSFPFLSPSPSSSSCHAGLNQDADLRCQSDASRVCVCVFARMNTHSMCVCMLAVNHASSEPRYPQSHGISGATQSPSVLRVTAHVPPQTRFLKPEKLL